MIVPVLAGCAAGGPGTSSACACSRWRSFLSWPGRWRGWSGSRPIARLPRGPRCWPSPPSAAELPLRIGGLGCHDLVDGICRPAAGLAAASHRDRAGGGRGGGGRCAGRGYLRPVQQRQLLRGRPEQHDLLSGAAGPPPSDDRGCPERAVRTQRRGLGRSDPALRRVQGRVWPNRPMVVVVPGGHPGPDRGGHQEGRHCRGPCLGLPPPRLAALLRGGGPGRRCLEERSQAGGPRLRARRFHRRFT